MAKAFLDTTVLCDALLEPGEKGSVAKASLKRFETVEVPTYALKEFKAGPLRAYVWVHNKAVAASSWADVIAGVATVMRQKNLASTAIQAIADFESSMAESLIAGLPQEGADETITELKLREATTWLQGKIFRAWRKRRRAPYEVVAPLPCFAEAAPTLKPTNAIDNSPITCTLDDCCLRQQFADRKDHTIKLAEVCRLQRSKAEMRKRWKVLRNILRRPHQPLTENECRTLGDAVFALQCPDDSTVLTTNLSDHEPLTKAVGKRAERP